MPTQHPIGGACMLQRWQNVEECISVLFFCKFPNDFWRLLWLGMEIDIFGCTLADAMGAIIPHFLFTRRALPVGKLMLVRSYFKK